MPWLPLPQIAFAVAIYPFQPSSPNDLPLELGDELYIIEQGGLGGSWFRGYLVAPPSLLAGLTSIKGQTLEARVFSGIFPRNCVEIREFLGEERPRRSDDDGEDDDRRDQGAEAGLKRSRSARAHEHLSNGETFLDANDGARSPVKDDLEPGRLPNGVKSEIPKRSHSDRRTAAEDPGSSTRPSRSRSTKKTFRASERGLGRSLSNRHRRQPEKARDPAAQMLTAPTPKRDPNAPKPPAPVPMLKVGDETPTSFQEPLVDEIASCLREWHSTHLHELLLAQRYRSAERLWRLVGKLDLSRRRLLHHLLTDHELESLRESIVWDLVNGNKLLGSDVVVRDPARRGRILTSDDSAVSLSKLQATMSLLAEPPVQPSEIPALHHLLFRVKGIAGFPRSPTLLVFYLCLKAEGRGLVPVTEAFVAEVPIQGTPGSTQQLLSLRALFTNLSPKDGIEAQEDSDLCLVVKVQALETIGRRLGPHHANGGGGGGGGAGPPSRDGSLSGRYNFGFKGSARGERRSAAPGQKGGAAQSSSSSYWSRYNQLKPASRSASVERPTGTPSSATEAAAAAAATTTAEVDASTPSSPDGPTEVARTHCVRTTGIGVLRVGQWMRHERDVEQTLPIWTSTEDHDWHDMASDLLEERSGHLTRAANNERMLLQLNSFLRSDAAALIKSTPTLLYNVPCTERIGFSSAPTEGRSDMYLTLNRPCLPPRALLTHPNGSQAPVPTLSDGTSILLTLEVRRANGERVERCVFPASNAAGMTTWQSVAIGKKERWNQVIRIALDPAIVSQCHVVMGLACAAEEPFALCWMPLWDGQALVRDGSHELSLYPYDEKTAAVGLSSADEGGYLSLPWRAAPHKADGGASTRATLQLQSFLCSTVLSQDQVILGLLSWRERSSEEVLQLLRLIAFVPEIEIVKLHREIFNALFGLMCEQTGNDEYEDLVFNALVTILGLVNDRRFNIGPLVERYVKHDFNYPFVAPCLIRSYTRLLTDPADPESSRRLRTTLKVGHHMLEFIVYSRRQQTLKEAGVGITPNQAQFVRELQPMFNALGGLMRNPAPTLVGTQTLAVQYFHHWIPVLDDFFLEHDVARVAFDFVDSCADLKGKLVLFKLLLILNYSRLNFFYGPANRARLVSETVRWLSRHWGSPPAQYSQQWRDQIRLCCSILAVQLNDLRPEEASEYIPKLVSSYRAVLSNRAGPRSTYSLLFPGSYPFPTRPIQEDASFDEALVETSAILAAIWNLSSAAELEIRGPDVADFLCSLLHVHMSILRCEAFPATWLSLHIYHHLSSLKALEYVAANLVRSYLPPPDDAENFHTDLWRAFFNTLLRLVASDALALETFPEQKRRAVWKIAGDVREQGADLLRQNWEAIGWDTSVADRRLYGLDRMGGYQVQYVPGLVCPIVELCLSVHEGLRSVATKVLQTMIISEWTLSQDLSVLQAEMVDSLDQAFKSRRMVESAGQKPFTRELMQVFQAIPLPHRDPFNVALQRLLETADEFIDLLVAVRTSEAIGEASHITHTLRLLEFLKDMQKEDIYIRYVHQLSRVQAQARAFTEAGLALKHHADLYSWDPMTPVGALLDPESPDESAFRRKERLYLEMVKYLEQGKSWHLALNAYDELAAQYRDNTFDLAKLADAERSAAEIHKAVAKGDRYAVRFFRVCFKGLGFPTALRDKQFVYEAAPAERLSSFCDRLQQLYPTAQLASSADPNDVEGQFLQVFPVSMHRDLQHPVFQRVRVPGPVRDHVLAAFPRRFSSTSRKPLAAPGASKQQQQQQQQQQTFERTLFTTAEPFPTLLRRSEIVAVEEVTLTPLQAAVERTVRKTQDLTTLAHRVMETSDMSPSILLEAVASSTDSANESSIARYRSFLPPLSDLPDQNVDGAQVESPQLDSLSNALRVALIDHALAVRRCMGWFGDRNNPHDRDRLRELTFSKHCTGLVIRTWLLTVAIRL